MLDPVWLYLVLGGSGAALLFQGVAIVLAFEMPTLAPLPASSGATGPKISVIVAARNEAVDLPACLDGLLAQDYPNLEILVVDGDSTDGTRDVVKARAPWVTLLREPPLPPGWVGKNWACDVGARAASGTWLLFTDADLRYHPSTVRATLGWAEREGADLASLAPRIETVGFWERVVLPFYTQMVLTYFRAPRVNRPRSSAAMANGQFTMVRRSAYDRVGGHAAIRSSVLEDVRLAQAFRQAGLSLRIAWAPDLIVTRMYRDRAEMFEGLLKNVHGTRYSTLRQLGFLVGLVGGFLLPLAVLPIGLAWGIAGLALWGAFLWLALFGKHAAFARGTRTPARYGLLFPLAVAYYVVLIATSIGRGVRRRPLDWKGRRYPLET